MLLSSRRRAFGVKLQTAFNPADFAILPALKDQTYVDCFQNQALTYVRFWST